MYVGGSLGEKAGNGVLGCHCPCLNVRGSSTALTSGTDSVFSLLRYPHLLSTVGGIQRVKDLITNVKPHSLVGKDTNPRYKRFFISS